MKSQTGAFESSPLYKSDSHMVNNPQGFANQSLADFHHNFDWALINMYNESPSGNAVRYNVMLIMAVKEFKKTVQKQNWIKYTAPRFSVANIK